MNDLNLSFQDMLVDLILLLPKLISGLVIFILSLYLSALLSKLIYRSMKKRQADNETTLLISQISRWTLLIFGTVAALQQVGFNLTAFLTGLGIIGFTIGFALQDVSKNFIAGLLLLIQQPFEIGDSIEVNGQSGTVIDINLRATEILTFDGINVQIPNGDVFTNAITNYDRNTTRRVVFNISAAHQSDLQLVRETVLEVVTKVNGVMDNPAPSFVYNNIKSYAVDFSIYFWVDTQINSVNAAKDAAVVGILQAFQAAGIEFPEPYGDLFQHA